MKPLSAKREFSDRQALALLLLFIPAAAILFFFFAPPATGDGRLDSLLNAVIPRFFISIFLLVLVLEIFPSCLSCKRISFKNLIWCIPAPFGGARQFSIFCAHPRDGAGDARRIDRTVFIKMPFDRSERRTALPRHHLLHPIRLF